MLLNRLNMTGRSLSFFRNTFFNYINVGLIIGINFLLVPLLIDVLGKEGFGIWQTMLSVISFAGLLNFGMGNGLRNLITKLITKNQKDLIGPAIGTTILKMGKIIIFFTFLLFPLAYFYFEPEVVFKGISTSVEEIRWSFFIFLFFFLFNIILNLSNSIAFGFQNSYISGLTQLIFLAICYLTIYISTKFTAITLIHVSLIFGATQSLSYAFFFLYQKRKHNLVIDYQKKFDLRETSRLSFKFFIVQLLAMLFLSLDNFIISFTLGPNETSEFSIINKIFFTLISLFSVLLIHFWNSVTDAFETKEIKWIIGMMKKLFLVAFGFLIISLGISFYQKNILEFWLGNPTFEITDLSFYLFSIYTFIHCTNAIFINLQNGLGFLKLQITSAFLMILIYLTGVYFFSLQDYGYNVLIVIKIVAISLALIVNSMVIIKLKSA